VLPTDETFPMVAGAFTPAIRFHKTHRLPVIAAELRHEVPLPFSIAIPT
jgi:hypothetical protein